MTQLHSVWFAAAWAILLASGAAMSCPTQRSVVIVIEPDAAEENVPREVAPAPYCVDPKLFFESLVARYRGFDRYEDTAHLVQVNSLPGRKPQTVESDIACVVENGDLTVRTPSRQVRDAAGLNVPVKLTPKMKEILRQFDLALAPHMALRFADEPLKEIVLGVDECFTPTSAQMIDSEGKKLMHVELRSGEGMSENRRATCDLYVDPESMLVRRVESEQVAADGSRFQTTLEITPSEETLQTPFEPESPEPLADAAPHAEPPAEPDPADPIDPPTKYGPG